MLSFLFRFVALSVVVILPGLANACTCVENEEVEETAFERYSFVALVKIEAVQQLNGPVKDTRVYRSLENQRILKIATRELYRGEARTYLLEADAYSSCGTFAAEGEEWIIYGWRISNGAVGLESCTPSTVVRNHKGESVTDYDYPQRALGWLNEYCNIRPATVSDVGSRLSRRYFANGNLAEEHHYRNGVLHGSSAHYYANGALMDLAYFRNGEPIAERIHCAEDGTMDFKLLFSEVGALVREINYKPDYDGLIHEVLYQQHPIKVIEKRFRPDGTLSFSAAGPQQWNWREMRHYDEHGHLVAYFVYDEEGEGKEIFDLRR